MAAITTRAGKGSPLTNAELDSNFTNINDGITTTAAITGGTINGTSIGATTPSTGVFSEIDVDNLELNGNTIISTNTDGNIDLTPNGTGTVNVTKLSASANTVISVTDNTNAALRITQLGTGDALLVEDSTNPDSTPIVINALGQVVVGSTAAQSYAGGSPYLQVNSTSASASTIGASRWVASATPAPQLSLAKSRGASVGTRGVVSSGDALGYLGFQGDDGTAFINAASITASVDGTPGTNDMPGRLVFSTTADGASSPTERMRIDSAGRVGIGTSSLTGTTFNVLGADSSTSGTIYGIYSLLTTTSASGSGSKFGIQTFAQALTGYAGTGSLLGGNFTATQGSASVNTGALIGARGTVSSTGAGTITSAVALQTSMTLNSASTIPTVIGLQVNSVTAPTSGTTTAYGVQVGSITGSTATYGVWSNIASGTTQYNFYAAGTAENYFGGNTVVSVTDNTNAALRITQLGTGNALLVEDSSNPDSTPFVIDASGRAVVGNATALSITDYEGVSRTPTLQQLGLGGSTSATYLSSWVNSNGNAPQLLMAKSKSGTIGTPGAVADGTDLGVILFSGDDGTTMIRAAQIMAEVDGTPGTNDMPGRLVFSTTADGASTPTERMRITSAGNVGINTSSPATQLVLAGNNSLLAENNTLRFWDTDTATQTDQQLGKVEFYSSDATAPGPSVKAYMGAFADDSSPGVYMAFATDAETGTPTERMRIDSSGNVGINGAPTQKLDVYGGAGAAVSIVRAASGQNAFFSVAGNGNTFLSTSFDIVQDSTNLAQIAQRANAAMAFSTNNTERMRIDSSGNLLVGTTSNFGKFTVSSACNTVKTGLVVSNTDTGAGTFAGFLNSAGNTAGSITQTGTTTVNYGTSSDYRLKTEIFPMEGALAKVQALKPCTYKWKDDGASGEGFIAHELAEIAPQCVVGKKDAVDAESKPIYQTIDTSFLVATLTAAIQELKALTDTQASTITALTARITALENK